MRKYVKWNLKSKIKYDKAAYDNLFTQLRLSPGLQWKGRWPSPPNNSHIKSLLHLFPLMLNPFPNPKYLIYIPCIMMAIIYSWSLDDIILGEIWEGDLNFLGPSSLVSSWRKCLAQSKKRNNWCWSPGNPLSKVPASHDKPVSSVSWMKHQVGRYIHFSSVQLAALGLLCNSVSKINLHKFQK